MSQAMQHLARARQKHNRFKMKCIVPDANGAVCGKRCMESHAIQHNGILSKLAENGMVYHLCETTNGDELFEYDLKAWGISSKATIFRCLCAEHDKKLFVDIEDRIFQKEPIQCYQYALKALLHSYWTKLNDADITKEYPDELPVVKQIIEDQAAYTRELECFWKILHTERYEELLTWSMCIDYEVACAVSTSINVCRRFDGELFGKENEDYPLLHISVFPAEGKSWILISCLKAYRDYYQKFTDQFILMSSGRILQLLNILLPLLAENIAISPSVINMMTNQAKREFLLIFRVETMSLFYQRGINLSDWADRVSYYIFGASIDKGNVP